MYKSLNNLQIDCFRVINNFSIILVIFIIFAVQKMACKHTLNRSFPITIFCNIKIHQKLICIFKIDFTNSVFK